MKEKVYVDRLFAGYEDTPDMMDFKEEIAGNLKERVHELITKGLNEEDAFGKAAAELGDITAIADGVGKKKRNETIGQMYMKAKPPVTIRTAGGFAAASGLLLLALGLAAFSFLSGGNNLSAYAVSSILLAIACGLYVYFGLTQDTAAHYAMKRGRALAYGVVCASALVGTGIGAVSFLPGGLDMALGIGMGAAFVLCAVCALVFLLATETKRQKPWLTAMVERSVESAMGLHQVTVDPAKAARFGAASGGLWILAVTVWITLHMVFGFRYAWLVFLFTLSVQVFMAAALFEKKK